MKKNLPVSQVERPFPVGKYIVSRTDLKGVITYANDAFVEISGFTRQETIGQSHNLVRHPDMPSAAFADLWRTVKAGSPWRGIVKNRCKNGDHYWVEALVVPVRQNDQTIGYMSVRTPPSRQEIGEAEALYARLNAGDARLPKTGWWVRQSLRGKLTGLVAVMLLFQLLGAAGAGFGGAIGLSSGLAGGVLAVCTALGVVVGGLLIALQNRNLDHLQRITVCLDRIGQGDLTERIPLQRTDELGQLNNALITMQTHIKAMMAEVGEVAREVSEGAALVNREMTETYRVSTAQAESANRIAAAVEQLAVSVEEVASSSKLAAEAALASRSLVNNASSSMGESRVATRNVVDTVRQAETTMAELFKSIFAIGQVTSAIAGISEQTNLLALNAAIEAARAGESGRGFAVVADEVRKLAERASLQTREITASVSEIQAKTQTAVAGMEAAGSHVARTDEAMVKAETELSEVAEQGQSVVDMSHQIAESTGQQSRVGEEIAGQVEGIVGAIDQTSKAIAAVNERASAMLDVARQLRELVGYFRYIR